MKVMLVAGQKVVCVAATLTAVVNIGFTVIGVEAVAVHPLAAVTVTVTV